MFTDHVVIFIDYVDFTTWYFLVPCVRVPFSKILIVK